MKVRRRSVGASIRTEGGLFPPDLLARIASGDATLPALTPEAYHLPKLARLGEAITRSWNQLLGSWVSLREAMTQLPSADPATTATRERWLLPLFGELGYGRLPTARAVEAGGRSYPVSHSWGEVPVHLVGWNVPIDSRTRGVAGAAGQSPYGLVQELLNRTTSRAWGFVSNGRVLRLLRDNAALTRQAYVEFDLEAMFDNEEYADFALLWLVCHESRLEGSDPEDFILERWMQIGAESGTRALSSLRSGVQRALQHLGTGFLAHPDNDRLRASLTGGELTPQAYYRELLRLVYRLIFLFAAEDRELLLRPGADPVAAARYAHYSTIQLRRLAERRRGSAHSDLWSQHRVVANCLAADDGEPGLALPPLGGFLFAPPPDDILRNCSLANSYFLDAIRELATVVEGSVLQAVDYRNIGSEELGSVYEALLELHPAIDVSARTFDLGSVAGSERKTSGSYYTPTSLITALLDTALDPVIADALEAEGPRGLLALRVVDPSAGSGHFLVAAAHRIAKALAKATTGEEEPAPDDVRHALRAVIGTCLYAVDKNELAVELCKVSLWLEALDPGRPLSFLDAHVRCGNALLGTSPALLSRGIPDSAYEPVEGDQPAIVRSLRRRNKDERDAGQLAFGEEDVSSLWAELSDQARELSKVSDEDVAGVRQRAAAHSAFLASRAYLKAHLEADLWCSAFFAEKRGGVAAEFTEGSLRAARLDSLDDASRSEVRRLAAEYGFFHWHLEFADVFGGSESGSGDVGGFDVVLGNPPWEKIKLQEQEFFASRDERIASAPNRAARQRLIADLKQSDPALDLAFRTEIRRSEAESHFIRRSGRYPLAGRGDVNTYSVFVEAMRAITGPKGRTGVIVPTGIATDDTTKHLFGDIVATGSLVSLYDFENRETFADVHRSYKFCLLTLTGPERRAAAAEFAFFAHKTADLADPERKFTLTPEDFALLNPNTRTAPIFRSRRDAELTKAVYRAVPVLDADVDDLRGDAWGVEFARMFDMATDSDIFRTRTALEAAGWHLEGNMFKRGTDECLPLYEAKMVHQFDHRFGDYSMRPVGSKDSQLPTVPTTSHDSPWFEPLPRYWVAAELVRSRLGAGWQDAALLGWRDTARSTDERTLIAAAVPRVAVGHTFPLARTAFPALSGCLLANLNSIPADYVARQKVGGIHVTYFNLRQLAILPPSLYESSPHWLGASLREWINARVLELTFTSFSVREFAELLGYQGAPFRWDDHRRFLLRCELDACYFHLYGLSRADVEFVLSTFPITERNDERESGEYRTKRVILEMYDRMKQATDTGEPYSTTLDPPPADPRVSHELSSTEPIPIRASAQVATQRYRVGEQLELPRVAEAEGAYGSHNPEDVRRTRRKRS